MGSSPQLRPVYDYLPVSTPDGGERNQSLAKRASAERECGDIGGVCSPKSDEVLVRDTIQWWVLPLDKTTVQGTSALARRVTQRPTNPRVKFKIITASEPCPDAPWLTCSGNVRLEEKWR